MLKLLTSLWKLKFCLPNGATTHVPLDLYRVICINFAFTRALSQYHFRRCVVLHSMTWLISVLCTFSGRNHNLVVSQSCPESRLPRPSAWFQLFWSFTSGKKRLIYRNTENEPADLEVMKQIASYFILYCWHLLKCPINHLFQARLQFVK